MNQALVVLSGGQDSTTCLFWAKAMFDVVHAITFDYGQRHAIELEAAVKVAELAGVQSHEIVCIPRILESASPLTSDAPLEQYSDPKEMERIIGNRVELTFVPMRNTLFLTIAMNRAVARKINNLVTGICQMDNANYPDCTEAFRASFQAAVRVSLACNDLHVLAPLMYYSKADSVRLAQRLPGCWEALAYSHTSYDGKYPPVDSNHANVLRAQGFEEAGLPDPLVVRAYNEGLMQLPATRNYDDLRFHADRDGNETHKC